MSTVQKNVRNSERLLEGFTWPGNPMLLDPVEGRRHLAIADVLCRIPEEDYQKLENEAEHFRWLIPHEANT